MASFLAICVALAVSVVYELIEWWAALAPRQGPRNFSAPSFALLSLARLHDRQMRRFAN